MTDASARAATAGRLRADVRQLLEQTRLLDLLHDRYGDAVVTGSAGYDLMVWRDIDIHLPVEAELWTQWAGLGADIASRLQSAGLTLHRGTYLNDYVDPQPLGPGLYWGIEFRDAGSHHWKCDIWGWDPFDFAVRQARDANLRVDLDRCDRDLLLRLKTEALERQDYYGNVVTSMDIYRFAIAGAGETLEELEVWKQRGGK